MQSFGGYGTYKNVAYSYVLRTHQWYATYECRLHRSLFDKKKQTCELEDFTVDGKKWCIRVEHTNGHLSCCLLSQKQDRAKAQYSVTLCNFDDAERNVTCHGSLTGTCWACDRTSLALATVSDINDPSSGFLQDDAFLLRLEMRVRTPQNESCQAITCGKTTICKWELRNLSGMSPSVISTETINVGGYRMRLKIQQAAESHGLKVLLESRRGCHCWITGEFCVPHRLSPDNKLVKNIEAEMDINTTGKDNILILDDHSLLDEASGFVDEHGWIAFTLTLSASSGKRFAARVLNARRESGDHLCTWPETDLRVLDPTRRFSSERTAVHAASIVTNQHSFSHELCLHCSFLNRRPPHFCTEILSMVGSKWYIAVKKTRTRTLQARLTAVDLKPVDFELRMKLVNFKDEANSMRVDKCEHHAFSGESWEADFCPICRLEEAASGFVRSGFFLVTMNLKVNHQYETGESSCNCC